ncbi:hypothetical protein V3C99_007105, partial [Haemonchus contortus]
GKMAHNVKQTVAEGFLASCYIFVLLVIVTSKAKIFKNAFYTMFVATGLSDVASIFLVCFLRLNRELSLGEGFHNIVLCCILIVNAVFVSHLIGNILITINRYSAIRHLNRYNMIWTTKNVWIFVVLQYVVSFAAFAHIIGARLTYVHNADGTVTFKGFEIRTDIVVRSTIVGASITYIIMIVVLNARSVFEWKRLSKINGSSKHRLNEKRLLIHAMLVSICTLSFCSVQFAKAIAVFTGMDELNAQLTMQLFWINDLMVSIPPFSLLLLSSDLRQELYNFLRHKTTQSVVNVSVSFRSTRRTVVGRF